MIQRYRRVKAFAAAFLFLCFGCYGPASVVDKRQAEAQRNLGDVYINQGQYTSALQELLKAEALNPDDPYLQNSLGMVYTAKGKLDQAVACFNKALALNPSFAPARNNLGSVYILQKNWDAAIYCLKELTGNLIYATPHFPLYNIGWAYFNKRDYKQAESFFLQALEIEPEYARALWGLGITFAAKGNTDAAIEQLQKAIKKEPEFAQAYLDLGKMYEIRGMKDNAVASYEKAVSLSANNAINQAAKEALKNISR